jgi:hypothetical protein
MSVRAIYGVRYLPGFSMLCRMGFHYWPDDGRDGREPRPLYCSGEFQAKMHSPSGSEPTEMGCCSCDCHRTATQQSTAREPGE